jgi:hypothetical protein
METWPLRFSRDIYTAYYGIKYKEDDIMTWVAVTLILVGVFLLGKSSND